MGNELARIRYISLKMDTNNAYRISSRGVFGAAGTKKNVASYPILQYQQDIGLYCNNHEHLQKEIHEIIMVLKQNPLFCDGVHTYWVHSHDLFN